MEEQNPTKGIQVNVDFRDIDTLTIVKSNTSLHVTVPSKWKKKYDLEAGVEIDVALLKVHYKEELKKEK